METHSNTNMLFLYRTVGVKVLFPLKRSTVHTQALMFVSG